MAIWKTRNIDLGQLNQLRKNTLGEVLDMRFIEVGSDYLTMEMPVDKRTHQPYGLLHGGASAALAETVGSVAGALCINQDTQICVGVEINCNHIRSVREGKVRATARPLKIGRRLHVWDIRICDDKEHLVCVSRLTLAILDKKNNPS